jgi:hypothetical protein
MLVEGSGIDPDVIAERGVRSVGKGRGQLPPVYSWRQKKRAPGILFTVHRPKGETATNFRPDKPNPKKPGHKYEQECKHLGGSGNVLDVHPSAHERLEDTSVPGVFTEGLKKADSMISAARREDVDILPVAISGVWNWLSEGEPIADMYAVPVEDRKVYVCFDSDMLRKPEVMMAAERLADHLEGRGAEVWIVYLPDQPDGTKTGADDFLAAGGTLGELLDLARPFDPDDLHLEKLSRDERLRRAFDYLEGQEREMPSKTRRECSKRAAMRASIAVAKKGGRLVEDGIEAIIPSMTGAEIGHMSQPTFSACILDFIDEGIIRRNERETSEQAYSYVLRVPKSAFLYNNERGRSEGEGTGSGSNDHASPRGYKEVRSSVPELRWPYVAVVREKDEHGRLQEIYEYVARLGKRRGEVVRYLLEHGGSGTVAELMKPFAGPKTRPRDFKSRLLADLAGQRRQHKGNPLSVGPPIIEIDGDTVRLVPDWLDALEEHRTLGGEQDAAIRQKADHLRRRAAYRKRNETKAERAPTEEEMAEGGEARQQRRRVGRLVYEGMSLRTAVKEVMAADGFIEELQRVEGPDLPTDDTELHPLDCECLGCSARAPSYARLVPSPDGYGGAT